MSNKPLIAGTRGSPLALIQTRHIISILNPFVKEIKEEVIKTRGDKILNSSLSSLAGKMVEKGLFVKELEEALLDERIDLAVHSLKDLPTSQPEGLIIAAIPPREDPWDCIITREKQSLGSLPPGSRIGTSSPRRIAQLRSSRPDLLFLDVRGNLGTRLKKLENGEYEALILARAGLNRLNWQGDAETIPANIMLHACGQGALAIECRKKDIELVNILVSHLEDKNTRALVTAERALLETLEGGCHIPVGAHASFMTDTRNQQQTFINLEGVIASTDGKTVIRGSLTGEVEEAYNIGCRLAQSLFEQGGNTIISSLI